MVTLQIRLRPISNTESEVTSFTTEIGLRHKNNYQVMILCPLGSSQWIYGVIITSLWRQNDATTSFWRHNDVIIDVQSYYRRFWIYHSIVQSRCPGHRMSQSEDHLHLQHRCVNYKFHVIRWWLVMRSRISLASNQISQRVHALRSLFGLQRASKVCWVAGICSPNNPFLRFINYANPAYCVATICHQVRCLRWGHLSHLI